MTASKKTELKNNEIVAINKKCPKCGSDVITYHTSNGDGTSTHRTLCQKKCDGWNPIREWDTGFSNVTKKYYG